MVNDCKKNNLCCETVKTVRTHRKGAENPKAIGYYTQTNWLKPQSDESSYKLN